MGTTFTETGAITQYVDVAQLVLYVFWGFFAGLIYYLLRENHREGYPMDAGRDPGPTQEVWPPVPEPKRFEMHDGQVFLSPDVHRPDGDYSAAPAHRFNGAPLEPVGDPLLAGVGPRAILTRAACPSLTQQVTRPARLSTCGWTAPRCCSATSSCSRTAAANRC